MKRGDIYYADLRPVVGSEQGGVRPVLIIQKQQKEIWNDEMYNYMHSIFGPDVIDMFDMKYNPQNVLNKAKDLVSEKTPKQE